MTRRHALLPCSGRGGERARVFALGKGGCPRSAGFILGDRKCGDRLLAFLVLLRADRRNQSGNSDEARAARKDAYI